MDYGRQHDLVELSEAIKNAKTGSERQHYEQIASRILNESDDIRYWRDQLIKASRLDKNDRNARRRVQYCIQSIQKIRSGETAGHSWGSNSGNRMVN
jgi:hypothetical protein